MRQPAIALARSFRIVLGALAIVAAAGVVLHLAAPVELTMASAALGLAIAALFAALVSHAGAGGRAVRDIKVSDELDSLSVRLLALENQVTALQGSGSRETSTITDIAGDISGLSGVVASLAEALATHERVLTAIGERAGAGLSYRAALSRSGPGARTADGPDAPVPSFFPEAEALPAPSPAPPSPARPASRDAAIVAAIEAGQIDLHVQPIVSLPQRRERVYEVYALLRLDGAEVLVPEEYGPAVERLGRTQDLDLLVLGKALAFAGRVIASGSDADTICRLSASSLESAAFWRALQVLAESRPAEARRIVLEIAGAAWTGFDADRRAAAAAIAATGVTYSLDQVAEREIEAAALARAGVRFVKLPASRILAADTLGDGESRLLETIISLARSGIQLVATRVEDERTVPELIELGIALAQGFAFAFPSPADAVALGGAAPGGRGEDGQPASPPDRRSLRSFLRRAG